MGIVGRSSLCVFSPAPFTGTLENNLVYANTTQAVMLSGAKAGAQAVNNTIYQPTGAGVVIQGASENVVLANNVIWIQAGHGIIVENDSQPGFASDYNDLYVTGSGHVGRWQNFNRTTLSSWRAASFVDHHSVSRDPLFVDIDGADNLLGWTGGVHGGNDDDFHLSSMHGSFHGGTLAPVATAGGLPTTPAAVETIDVTHSPLIDRGDAATPFANEPLPNGNYVNMGAYGDTPQASKSPSEYTRVLKPDGGESWPQKQTFTIEWRSHDLNGNVDIDLLQDGNLVPIISIADDTPNDGLFSWFVPDTLTPANNYRIRVQRSDSGIGDLSDGAFRIAAPVAMYYVNDLTVESDDWSLAPGDDGNDGFSPLTPKASLRALLEAYDLGPGDVVRVDNGEYSLTVNIPIEANDSGVLIEGFNDARFPSRRALLNRGNNSPGSTVFILQGADDITLDNLSMTGAYIGVLIAANADSDNVTISNSIIFSMASMGISVDTSNDNLRLEYNRVSDSETGIAVSQNNAVLDHNEVFRNSTGIQLSQGPIGSANIAHDNLRGFAVLQGSQLDDNNEAYDNDTGVYVANGTITDSIVHDNRIGIATDSCDLTGNLIAGNYVFHNSEIGIIAYHDSTIRDNVVHDNPIGIWGAGTICSFLNYYTGEITNNLSYSNADSAVLVSLGNGATVNNNTIYQPQGRGIRVEEQSFDISLRNNIIWTTANSGISVSSDSETGFVSDYNNLNTSNTGTLGEWEEAQFATHADWLYEVGLDQHSVIGDPQFVELDGSDNTLGFLEGGLTASYFANTDLSGTPVVTRREQRIDVEWDFGAPIAGVPEDGFSVRWEGFVRVPVAGTYTFYSKADDGERLLLDGNLVIDHWEAEDGIEHDFTAVNLAAGWHSIRYEVYDDAGFASAALSWSSATTIKRPIQSRFFSPDFNTLLPGDYGADDNLQVQATSPTIDAGDPASGFIHEPEPNGRRVNLGHSGDRTSAQQSSPGSLQVLAPNGFEKLELSQTVAIQWHTSGLPATTLYRDRILVDTPLVYYKLDELLGTAASDTSGNNQHGVYVNDPILNQLGATFDPSNRSVQLNGTDNAIRLPTGFSDFSNGLALEVWVYPTSNKSSQAFVALGNSGNQDVISLGTSFAPETLQFLGIEAHGAVELNRWQHFAGVVDAAGNVTLFKNGAVIGTGTTPLPNIVPRTQNFLGRSTDDTTTAFQGLLDEAAIYGHSLTPTQVATHYTTGITAGIVDLDLVNATTDAVISVIANDTPNDGEFLWTIPADVPTGANHAVRIRTGAGSPPQDRSDGAFSIASNTADFYVNDTLTVGDVLTTAVGSNSNDGKSAAKPMRSLHALLNAYDLAPGDVVHVDTGDYRVYRELILEESDSGAKIEGPSTALAHLQRSNRNLDRAVFVLAGADDITLNQISLSQAHDGIRSLPEAASQRFRLSNSVVSEFTSRGVSIDTSSLDSQLISNRVHDSFGTGLEIQGANSLIEGNTIWHVGTGIDLSAENSIARQNDVFANAIGIQAINNGTQETLITENRAFDNSIGFYVANQIRASDNSAYGNSIAGIMVSGSAVADSNTVWDNFDGIVQNQSFSCDARIINNRVYHNLSRGISLVGFGVAEDNVVYDNSYGITGESCNFITGFVGTIANNVVYENANGGIVTWGGQLGATLRNNTVVQTTGDAIRIQDRSADVSIRNNILKTRAGFAIAVTADSVTGIFSDYNDLITTGSGKVGRWESSEFATRAAWSSEIGVDQHSITADPQFIDIDGADDILGFNEGPFSVATIIDDNGPGFSTTGSWQTELDGFGGDSTDSAGGSGDSFATWTFTGLIAGATYQVAATWVPSLTLSSNTEFQIVEGSTVLGVEQVNQFSAPTGFIDAGATWQTLALTQISGASLTVRLDNRRALGRVRADAIRIQRVRGDHGADDNFHVQSGSPTIDAGSPADYYLREPQPNGERVNQGSDGNRSGAATSAPTLQLLGPNGFEKLELGQATKITWRESGLRSERVVALMNSGGATVDNWLFDDYGSATVAPLLIADPVDITAMSNPAPPAVYQSMTTTDVGIGNSLSYTLPVPDGNYTVRLHFVEPTETAAGSRVFDIVSQNSLVANNYDIFSAAGGRLRAVTRSFSAAAVNGLGLTIDLINETDLPALLAAVEVTTTVGGESASTVTLDLSTNNGSTWVPLANNLAMDRFGRGSFIWNASPVTSGNSALVRVTSTEVGTLTDRSDNPFMVVPAGNHFYLNDTTTTGDVFTTGIGNNLNDGKSPATPMANLRALLAAFDLDAGDVIHIDTGTYRLSREAELSAEDSGVRIEGPTTAVATLDRGNAAFGPAVLRLTGADDVTLVHLELTGARIGIWADSQADSDQVTISNSELHHFGVAAIQFETSNDRALLAANLLHDNQSGIISGGVEHLLRQNRVFDNDIGITVSGIRSTAEENELFGNRYGILADHQFGSEPIQILRNLTHHNQVGINAIGNVVVSDNSVYGNSEYGILADAADVIRNRVYGNLFGIRDTGCTPNHVISYNRVWNNSLTGISLNGLSAAIGNQIYDNLTGIVVNPCHSTGTTAGPLLNNVIYNNTTSGVLVSNARFGLQLVNNTIYQSFGNALRIGEQSSGVGLHNNILMVEAGYDVFVTPDSQTGFSSDFNLLHQSPDANAHVGFFNNGTQDSLNDWQSTTGQDAHSIVLDPRFVDINGADNVLGYSTVGLGFDGGQDDNFHLHATSPAIDAAQAWYSPTVDRELFERADDPGTINSGSLDYIEKNLGINLFSEDGVAQSFRGDNQSFALDLPFAFPFYGENYARVYVSTEGILFFEANADALDGNNSDGSLRMKRAIAPLWDNLDTLHDEDDMFVDSSIANQVTIRWDATLTADESDIQVSVTLFQDGRIRFDYGPGNSSLSPTIGLSRGVNGVALLSSYNQVDDLSFKPSLEFALTAGATYSDLGAHEFQGDSRDLTPPTVNSARVESHVAVNGTPFTHIHVGFSEPVDTIDANAPANYDFREDGIDGLFDSPDDVIYAIVPHYVFGSRQAIIDVAVTGGILPSGNYRIRISGNTSIHDLAGNRLDGDNNGTEGGDAVATNQSPTLAPIANRTIDEGQSVSFTATASDLDARQSLTYSLDTGAPTGALINASTGAFTWTPTETQDGVHRITVRVADNGTLQLNDIKTFTVTVQETNEPPVLTNPGNKSLDEKTLLSFSLSALDIDVVAGVPDAIRYTIQSGALPGMLVNPLTGAFNWMPIEAQDGQHIVVFRVKDNHDLGGTDQTITISVREVNDAPVLTNPGNKNSNEKALLSFSIAATDTDSVAGVADSVSYSISSGNVAGMLLNASTGAFSWTPSETHDGEYVVVFRATDNHGLAGTDQTVTLSINETNDPPALANPGNRTADEKTAITFSLVATDPDVVGGVADSVSYSMVSGAATGMLLGSSTGSFSWTPGESQDGRHLIVFRGTDNHSLSAVDQTVTITVNEVNEAPVLANPGNKSIHEKILLNFSLVAGDGDIVEGAADSVTYSVVSGILSGMTLDSSSGSFSWTPSEAQDGEVVLVFNAKDNHNLASSTQTVTIAVAEVNEPPVLVSPGNKSGNEKAVLSFSVNATDGDVVAGAVDTMTYLIGSGELPGMSLNSTTGAFSWTPIESQDGSHVVVFRANDNHDLASNDQTITVTVAEINDPPTLTNPGNKSVDENAELAFSLSATDGDAVAGIADTLTFGIAAGELAGMSLNNSTGAFRWTPTSAQSGQHVIVFKARDNHGAAGTDQTSTLTVVSLNDPPTSIQLTNSSVKANISGATVGNLSATDPDAGQTHTFSTTDARFEIVGSTLKLKSDAFVTGTTVDVEITATDNGTPSRATTRTLVINVLANARAWQNSELRFDTNADGSIVPLDALRIINQLNEPTILGAGGKLPDSRPASSTLPFYDANGDGFCTSNDVLQIVNFLNSLLGEGESQSVQGSANETIFAIPQELSTPARESEMPLRLVEELSASVLTELATHRPSASALLLELEQSDRAEDDFESVLADLAEDVLHCRWAAE